MSPSEGTAPSLFKTNAGAAKDCSWLKFSAR